MKKKILCVLIAFFLALPCLYNPLTAKAIAPVPVPFIFGTAWDSTVTAYGALKGLQFGQNASTPEIVGDYTKPYQYQPESITPLKPSWDALKSNWIADNFAGIYPALSEEDAKNALDKQWEDFDNAIGLGNIDITSSIYKAFEGWIASLVGTEYMPAKKEYENFTLTDLNFPKTIPISGATSVNYYSVPAPPDAGQLCGMAVSSTNFAYGERVLDFPLVIGFFKDGAIRVYTCHIVQYNENEAPPHYPPQVVSGVWVTNNNPVLSGDIAYYGDNNDGVALPATDSFPILGSGVETEADVISQFPVNPNDNNDKDNKKIAVLPNVPSLKDNLNNLANVNGGKLPIKFPDPDPVTGLIPSIPVLGNNGVTINIPVTNNNYQVINNYDQHQEIYNENNSYPTINYNYVNYYINEGAMTYEQFLQALQEYFNVIVYNNETNNYYPSVINNTTNNYYTIEEVINEEIPPILPPLRIAITDRFPFCLPFDIYKILVLFNAEPTPWEWDVPVPTFKSGGTSNENYHGEIGHIDFSETMHITLEKWEPVALVLRTGLAVLWLLYLCFLFQKLVH